MNLYGTLRIRGNSWGIQCRTLSEPHDAVSMWFSFIGARLMRRKV